MVSPKNYNEYSRSFFGLSFFYFRDYLDVFSIPLVHPTYTSYKFLSFMFSFWRIFFFSSKNLIIFLLEIVVSSCLMSLDFCRTSFQLVYLSQICLSLTCKLHILPEFNLWVFMLSTI